MIESEEIAEQMKHNEANLSEEEEVEDEEVGSTTSPPAPKKDAEVLLEEGMEEAAAAFVPEKTKPFIVLVACCAALGGLVFGYDIAGAGATFVMDGFQEHFGWTCALDDVDCSPATQNEIDIDKGLINGLFGIGACFGAFLNPFFAEKLGRRPALFFSNCVFIFGASIQAAAPNMQTMWGGRVFSGMGKYMLLTATAYYPINCLYHLLTRTTC